MLRNTKQNYSFKGLKVALVHDYLREYGGAERVVEALHEVFPKAPLYVAFVDSKITGVHWSKFASWDIRQTWLTKLPWYKKLFSPYRLFAPWFFSSLDLSEYDLVISSTNAYFSKAVTTRKNGKKALHISYCHTPARSLYGYTTMTHWKNNPITHFLGKLLNHYLRVVDFRVANDSVDYFIANSKETQRRIKKFYHLNSTVIYPPIEIAKGRSFKDSKRGNYYLFVGRLAMSKHLDLAIKTANRLKFKLKVVGSGRSLAYFQSIAGKTVEFLSKVDDDELYQLYEDAKALLYPAEDEDFGMVPLEAMGHGVPVIAHRSGGPLETIKEGMNGIFFNEFSVDDFAKAVTKLERMKFDRDRIYYYSLKFDKARFKQEVNQFVRQKLNT